MRFDHSYTTFALKFNKKRFNDSQVIHFLAPLWMVLPCP